MNRRHALHKIFFIGGVGAFSFSGYSMFKLYWTPNITLLDSKQQLIASLANAIIPKSESPGAASANVDVFIMKMLKNCTVRQSLNNFINGLNSLERSCYNTYSNSFVNCTEEQKYEILRLFERKQKRSNGIIGKVKSKFFGDTFITLLKQYTIKGYCTSRVGATDGLNYSAVPGKYIGCTRMETHQKAWATN